ncbi:MAG TPA: class I SAM-dependent methyltransferase [Methanolinea sp.]|nr:class I SAM-dependent methyltransferase [Methanolinea sp.]HQK56222.1 class I SAM-dependent methyltransferase [Methanolinea sp.]
MNALEALYLIHSGLPRLGPGSNECTTRAYRSVRLETSSPIIVDTGCGSGASALVLSRLSGGTVIAVDNYRPFLLDLRGRAWALLGPRQSGIQPIQASMGSLPLRKECVDLVWSEGAIYLMGFAEGLVSWRPLLKKGGFLVVSEVIWLKSDVPDEIRSYWTANYPGIASDASHRDTIAKSGFVLRDSFPLPASAWWNYYRPLQGRMRKFRREYADDASVQQVLDEIEEEIGMFERYQDSYTYVMYILEKPDA